jgi:catechol 2,3-dioxygenase-like lactoylglutathione lyase family enzyme
MLLPIQIALTTTCMTSSLRLYAEAFGFRHAGGNCSWGSKIQALGADSETLLWWLVGRQDFFQVEMFQYTRPVTRPLAADWRPCDHGWTRFGIVVADFDATLRALRHYGVVPMAPVLAKDGRRHAAIRDPHVGAVIEIIESDPKQAEGPRVAYITSSVSNAESARAFYRDVLQYEILPLERLHTSGDESLWCLAGAARDGFAVSANGVFLEVVEYRNPRGRPKPQDWRLSDQGIMNVALGSRDNRVIVDAFARLKHAGLAPPFMVNQPKMVCGYISTPEREFELLSVLEGMDGVAGFLPAPLDFFRTGHVDPFAATARKVL